MTDRFSEEAWVNFLAGLAKHAPPDTAMIEKLTDITRNAVEQVQAVSKSLSVAQELKWFEKTLVVEQERREAAGKATHKVCIPVLPYSLLKGCFTIFPTNSSHDSVSNKLFKRL